MARGPGLTETIDHLIEPNDSGTLITQRTVFTGPLASIAARILGGRVRKTFEATTAHFGRLAERRAGWERHVDIETIRADHFAAIIAQAFGDQDDLIDASLDVDDAVAGTERFRRMSSRVAATCA